MITERTFSEVEVAEIGIRVEGATEADANACVGTMEEELEVKTVTKKCRGIIAKSRTKGTGKGTVKMTLHIAHDVFAELYGMTDDKLKDGVISYGQQSLHPVFCLTAKVKDEDDNVKLKAYPRATIQSGFSRKIENGAEEIAEIEMEIAITPDEYGNGLYEAILTDMTDDELKTNWMSKFTPEMARKVIA